MKTKKMTALAILSALAFVTYLMIQIPIMPAAPYLEYEPKDVIITIAGFIYGPLSAAIISIVVSFVEMLLTSTTGVIGFIMNVLSTCAFSCVAALVYRKKKTVSSAVIGLVLGGVAMTIVMILWNYLLTPLYLGVDRNDVIPMLLPVFGVFNVIKSSLNIGIILLVYKPIVSTLRKLNFIDDGKDNKSKLNVGVLLLGLVILATTILIILVLKGII